VTVEAKDPRYQSGGQAAGRVLPRGQIAAWRDYFDMAMFLNQMPG
jgi:hypothetical protein